MKSVPNKLKGCSPVAVKATAGLRILGPEKSGKILEAVRHRLETAYPFPVVSGSGVEIMEGKDEGTLSPLIPSPQSNLISTLQVFMLGSQPTTSSARLVPSKTPPPRQSLTLVVAPPRSSSNPLSLLSVVVCPRTSLPATINMSSNLAVAISTSTSTRISDMVSWKPARPSTRSSHLPKRLSLALPGLTSLSSTLASFPA